MYYREVILRVLLTAAMLTVIRSGHFIPMPGVELTQLPLMEAHTEGGAGGGRLRGSLRGAAEGPAAAFTHALDTTTTPPHPTPCRRRSGAGPAGSQCTSCGAPN